MQSHGGDIYRNKGVIDFSANINPLGIPGCVKEVEKMWIKSIMNYPDVDCSSLRKEIAAYEKVEKKNIICGNGASELIFSITAALKPGKALLISPSFLEYERALQAAETEILYYELAEESGFRIGEDYLDLLTEEIDMVFLCNPNNPTGISADGCLLDQIVQKCFENNIYMVCDECFHDFLETDKQNSLISQTEKNPMLFVLKAFTKIYAMPGLRLGYAVCSNMQLIDRVKSVMQPWNVSALAQIAGVFALQEEGYVEKTRAFVAAQKAYLVKHMEKLGIKVWNGEANYLFFKSIPGLYKKCLDRGVMIRDCSNFRNLSEGYYRIAIRTGKENERFILILQDIMKENDREG